MHKKLLSILIVIVALIFSFNVCFAADGMQDAVDGVRNVVGGAENAVEDAARDISNASKDATGDLENGGNSIMENGDNNNTKKDTINETRTNMNNNSTLMNDNNNGNYTAVRTATEDNTFMGMGATAWTWLILGIAAIGIIALVWYYSTQMNGSHNDNRD